MNRIEYIIVLLIALHVVIVSVLRRTRRRKILNTLNSREPISLEELALDIVPFGNVELTKEILLNISSRLRVPVSKLRADDKIKDIIVTGELIGDDLLDLENSIMFPLKDHEAENIAIITISDMVKAFLKSGESSILPRSAELGN